MGISDKQSGRCMLKVGRGFFLEFFMSPISLDQEQQIRQVLRDCGQQAERMADKDFDVFEKGPEDYVTNIDASLDHQLGHAFSILFPEDGVISEENVQSRSRFQAAYPRLWCIDPLDGTEDFIHRKRDYAVMVGLLQDYEPIAGWIYAPAYDRVYYGGQSWGVFQAIADQPGQPVALAAPDSFVNRCPIVIGTRDYARYGAAIAQQIPDAHFYSLGSFGLKVMEVVLGRAALYLYFNGRVKLWDTTGPLALARAAGLICCDLQGQQIDFSPSALYTETLTHKQPIVIGWPHYMTTFLPKLQQAVQQVQQEVV